MQPLPRRWIATSLVLLAASCAVPGDVAAERRRPDLSGLDDVVRRAMATMDVPGLSLALVDRHGAVLTRGYGVRALGEDAPVDERTLFDIGSITKTFTATAVALQVELGELAWSTRIAERVPGFAFDDAYVARELTLADVLSHRAGYEDDYFYDLRPTMPRAELLQRLGHVRALHAFRTTFEYHNALFALSADVLFAVTGQTWAVLVEQQLLLPLGMHATCFYGDGREATDNAAARHELTREGVRRLPVDARGVEAVPSAGALRSNAVDMAQWCRFQLGGFDPATEVPLSERTVRAMRTQHVSGTFDWFPAWGYGRQRAGYGLGWMLLDYRDDADQHVAHGGATTGMQAWMVVSPRHGYAIAIMSNAGWAGDRVHFAIANWIHDRYLGLEPFDWGGELLQQHRADYDESLQREAARAPRDPGRAPSLALGRYVGSYEHPTYGPLLVREQGGALRVQLGRLEATAVPWGGESFFVDWNDRSAPAAMLTFDVVEDQVRGLRYEDGMTFPFVRGDGR